MEIVNETAWGAKREDAAGEEKHAFLARIVLTSSPAASYLFPFHAFR
jgi:hypothetical protein